MECTQERLDALQNGASRMTTLPALIEKLRGLKDPDREVDIAIVKALYPFIGECSPLCEGDEPIFWDVPFYKQPCPPLTASLDAVVDLIEREGAWDWSIHCDNGEAIAGVQPASEDGCDCADAHAPTPALALLIAFLEAKMEMEK